MTKAQIRRFTREIREQLREIDAAVKSADLTRLQLVDRMCLDERQRQAHDRLYEIWHALYRIRR